MDEPVRLRRSPFARLRFTGALEVASAFCTFTLVLIAIDAVGGEPIFVGGLSDVVLVVLFFVGALLVRLAVWTEYVEADATTLRWRSLYREDTVPAERIEWIDVTGMYLLGQRHRSDVLRVRHVNGRTRKIRASAWCSSRARGEWVDEVRLLWAGTSPFAQRPGPPRGV